MVIRLAVEATGHDEFHSTEEGEKGMDKIIRVDMTVLKVTTEAVPAEWVTLGGRALTSTVVAAEVPPTCHPLGPNNKLVFAPGTLSGTPAANSGRMSVGGKSPLTGGIKESSSGGTTAQQFARMGIKALIIEGRPRDDKWYHLHITMEGVTIEEETEVIGYQNFAVIEAMEKRYDSKVGVMSIGVPGEKRMRAANISVKIRTPRSAVTDVGAWGLSWAPSVSSVLPSMVREPARCRSSIARNSRKVRAPLPRRCSTTR